MGQPQKTVRERIIEAAVKLLRTEGATGFSQPRVAKEVGIPQGHLTYYFPKRADLLTAVVAHFVDGLAEELVATVTAVGLEGGVPRFVQDVTADRDRTRILLSLLVEAEAEPALREPFVEGARQMREAIGAVLGKPPDHPEVALMQATAWGLGIQHLLFREQTAEHVSALLSHLWRGHLGKPGQPAPRRRTTQRTAKR